jgi:Kef-type K+ transport system membrane component KefB
VKTCALYGFAIALGDALLVLALFFLGFHSDPAKLPAAQWIGGLGALAIGVTLTTLGVKARRSEVPEAELFGYGSALWEGLKLSFVACLLTAAFNYAYSAYINPGLTDIIVEDRLDKMQARGMSSAQTDQAEKFIRFMMSPGVYAVYTFILGMIFALVLCLIIAAFLKRGEPEEPPLQA